MDPSLRSQVPSPAPGPRNFLVVPQPLVPSPFWKCTQPLVLGPFQWVYPSLWFHILSGDTLASDPRSFLWGYPSQGLPPARTGYSPHPGLGSPQPGLGYPLQDRGTPIQDWGIPCLRLRYPHLGLEYTPTTITTILKCNNVNFFK